MLTVRETALSLSGVWQLAHFDPQGMDYFDRSVEGFWRSFRVAVLIAPAYALLVSFRFMEMPVEAGWLRLILVEGIAYVISWVAFPLAVFHVSRMLGRETEFVGYIVAYNWASILRIGVFLPAMLIAAGGVVPEGLSSFLLIMVQLAILVFDWFVAKAGLRIDGLPASGIVALNIMISALITATANGMVT